MEAVNIQDIKQLKEVLEVLVAGSPQIIIVPHNKVDFDALGAAAGLWHLCKRIDKNANVFILVNEDPDSIRLGTKTMFSIIKEQCAVIDSTVYDEIRNKKDLLIFADVNKKYMVPVKDLDEFENKIIIDHHEPDKDTIDAKYKYILPDISSASEIVASMIINEKIANALYAGMTLDTKRWKINTSADTLEIASKLCRKGADINYVSELFKKNFGDDRRIQDLISLTKFHTYTYAVASGPLDEVYDTEELATAADYLQDLTEIDASFSIGMTSENTIGVSGRCANGNIHIGNIVGLFKNGGGNKATGGAKIDGTDIEEVGRQLRLFFSHMDKNKQE